MFVKLSEMVIYPSRLHQKIFKDDNLRIAILILNKKQYTFYINHTVISNEDRPNEMLVFYSNLSHEYISVVHKTTKNSISTTASFTNMLDIGVITVERENQKTDETNVIIKDKVVGTKYLDIDRF